VIAAITSNARLRAANNVRVPTTTGAVMGTRLIRAEVREPVGGADRPAWRACTTENRVLRRLDIRAERTRTATTRTAAMSRCDGSCHGEQHRGVRREDQLQWGGFLQREIALVLPRL
jgi:hypothetical protein